MKKRRGGPPARLRAAPHVAPLIFPPHRARRRLLGSRQPGRAASLPDMGADDAVRRDRTASPAGDRLPPRLVRFRDSGRSAAVLILSADGWQERRTLQGGP